MRRLIKKLIDLFYSYKLSNRVKSGYENNDYNNKYRISMELTTFEQHCIDRFLKLLPQNPQIIDLGCGSGITYDRYLLNNNCKLTGVDFSKKQIAIARKFCPEAKFLCINILGFSFTEKYDGVVMLYSLFHIYREYHFNLLKRIYSCLENGGKVLLNVRLEDSGHFKYKQNFCGKPMYWSHYMYSNFEKIAQEVGFNVRILGNEKDYGSEENHLWLILFKDGECCE